MGDNGRPVCEGFGPRHNRAYEWSKAELMLASGFNNRSRLSPG